MNKGRSRAWLVAAVVAAVMGAFAAQSSPAQEGRMIELALPRPAARGEAVQLRVTVGPLAPGSRLAVVSEDGEILGAVAPFSQRGGGSTTATIPIPRTAIVDGRLRARLQVVEPGAPPRPARDDEVRELHLVLAPQSE